MLCDEVDIAEPAHACYTPNLAVYSHIVFSEAASVITWYNNILATFISRLFQIIVSRLDSLLAPCWPQGL